MSDLTTLTTPTKIAESQYTINIPEGWQQGRGAFGGLVLAIVARAMQMSLPPSAHRQLRTLTATLCGPTQPGEAQIIVEVLRLGSGVSSLAARLVQQNETQLHAVATFGKRRVEDGDWQRFTPPQMPNWRELDPLPIEPPLAPQFSQHFQFRTTEHLPFSGVERAEASGWIQPKHPESTRDDAYIVALADAWWPAALTRFDGPRPMATLSFTLEIMGDLEGLPPDAPLYHSASCLASRDGYTSEDRKLWGEDGRLIAINHQTMVIIK
jgi:acyl-CoA thioesterase